MFKLNSVSNGVKPLYFFTYGSAKADYDGKLQSFVIQELKNISHLS